MATEKSLAQLGLEYERAAQIVTARIKAAREKLSLLADDRCGLEAYRIKSDLNVLYRERRDALETAKALLNYYSRCEAEIQEAAA